VQLTSIAPLEAEPTPWMPSFFGISLIGTSFRASAATTPGRFVPPMRCGVGLAG